MKILKLLYESILTAFGSLIINKLRTSLSLLGITIGIFAIISVYTVIDWMESGIRESLSSFGNDVVYVQKYPWIFDDESYWKIRNRPTPTYEEFQILMQRMQKASAIAFSLATVANIKYENNSASNSFIWAVTHDFEKIWFFEIEKGRYFSLKESHSGKNRAVIGYKVARELFGDVNPVGKECKVMGRKVLIVGVLKKEGKGVLGGDSGLDERILMPVNYVRNLVNMRSEELYPFIMVKAKEGVTVAELKDDIRGIMRSIRRLKPRADDNFALNELSALNRGFESVFSGINLAGMLIGGFSILVGGFGIANIMFVSVKERTNIIGIEKALGAKRYFILWQFLFEAILLCLVGGVVGLMLIFFGTLIINGMNDELQMYLTLGNVVRGVLISSLIGLISGFVPAYQASRLNPVEAIGTTF